MNFRKRIRILPGVTLNLSKSGISTTIGVKGLSVNIAQNGLYLNTGIPGTGLYQRQKIGNINNQNNTGNLNTKIYEQVEKLPRQDLTSEELFGLKTQIVETYNQRITIQNEIASIKKTLKWLIIGSVIFGFISLKNFDSYYINAIFVFFGLLTGLSLIIAIILKILKSKNESILENLTLRIDVSMDEQIEMKFKELNNIFSDLQTTNRAFYISSQEYITNRIQKRTSAAFSVNRNEVNLYKTFENNFIITPYQPIILNTVNDGTLLLYPGFLVIIYNNPEFLQNSIHVTKWEDLSILGNSITFHEEEGVPSDSEIVGRTWKYVNKNGSPDKRYAYNPEIPIVNYYELTIVVSNKSGYCYHISNVYKGEAFYKALENFKSIIIKLDWNDDKKKIAVKQEEKFENKSETHDTSEKPNPNINSSPEKPVKQKKEIDITAIKARYENALKSLPTPAAFSDAKICLRQLYKKNQKEQILKKLYNLAVIESFIQNQYSEIAKCPSFRIMEKAFPTIKTLPIYWNDIGYKKLNLNTSDITVMRELWGEPENHTTFYEKYKDLYKDIEIKLKENYNSPVI
ncbi:MAG: DUF4236 domain-containing protein [Treponema sp.]|uniref:DUF4236 domain-containing protein n=1 Tax=Treponema sp. TaxID=166 RepID=UPI00298D7B3F|nr:DUF4236 domain-containing protein [Treponema sp.]MBR5932382.1 DUF4236 domain-containing protein [Treponema sp.]